MQVIILALAIGALGEAHCGAVGLLSPRLLPAPAPLYRTVIPAHTKAFGYSTTQFINSPTATYSVGFHPQIAYHIPQYSAILPQYSPISSLSSPFYPLPSGTYYPPSIFYPHLDAPSPVNIQHTPTLISPTTQPAGDEDTAVIDSAAFGPDQQQSSNETPVQSSSPSPLPPAGTFPNFPQYPQDVQFPQYPLFPHPPAQAPGQIPLFPSYPGFPQNPSNFPSSTQTPPSSYPSGDNNSQGLNDEDTVSVESA